MRTEFNMNSLGYSIEDLKKLKTQNKVVVGCVKKYLPNECLIIDLGKNIEARLSIDNFEDSESSSLSGIISKVGSKICAFIEDIDEENNEVILNRSSLHNWYKSTVLESMDFGTIFDTNVVSVAPFGVFVDMGYGVVGLLPMNDISIARLPHLRGAFKVGDSLKVVYKGKSSSGYVVSHKELLGTWEENVKDFTEGEVLLGIIRDIKPYGAFIEISPNLTGLADISEDSSYKVGESVTVLFKSYNLEKQKVKLHIIKSSATDYKPKYNYKVSDGRLEEWVYTPVGSKKEIKTVFNGRFNENE